MASRIVRIPKLTQEDLITLRQEDIDTGADTGSEPA
jgi:hypothetical protein